MPDTDTFVLEPADIRLGRATDGQVLLHRGEQVVNVGSVMSAFPLTRPGHMVSIRDEEGEEIGLLRNVAALDPRSRRIMEEELERAYFMPRIRDIVDIREELSVVTWEVETDRGPRQFEVRNVRQNVRRMGRRRFVIKDVDGNRYEIQDWADLPPAAQRIIWNHL
jgi:hypothetical protein